MDNPTPACLVCDRNADEVPVLGLTFRGTQLHICPQHLPILIHDPARLIGRLPGAETLSPAEHHD